MRRAWAPFLYVVDSACFLLVILALYFIFFASMWGTYSITGTQKQTPYSWGVQQTAAWGLLSAIGVLRFFFVVLSCTDHQRMRRARRQGIMRIQQSASSLHIGRPFQSSRPPQVNWQHGVPMEVLRPPTRRPGDGKW
jgi:hypothetical protein